jgi:hypothetical protein
MRAVVRTAEPVHTRQDAPGAAPRRTKVVVRRIDPWSVLKFSLLFYFCLMLVFVFALMILYWIMGLTGVLNSASHLLESVGFKPTKGNFEFHGVWIFERLFLAGLIGVVLWSIVNLFVAVLYNLISDVIGGVSVTLAERR